MRHMACLTQHGLCLKALIPDDGLDMLSVISRSTQIRARA